ncbi:MAG: carbohydrate kinase [Deltaproteobacteria bacterium]|nr:carbohydrate kinase [Deltaproteobacteria bacterium]
MDSPFDLLLAGHLTEDRILRSGEELRAPGGAVYYGAFPAALTGARVGVLTKLAPEDRALLDELLAAGIQVVVRPSSKTTRIRTEPKTADFERRAFHVESRAEAFEPADCDGLSARIAVACPLMRGEMSLAVIQRLAGCGRLALDVQGFVRRPQEGTLRSGDWEEKAAGLAAVHTLKTDRREVELLTGSTDVEAGLRALAALGPSEILCTHSRGVTLLAGGELHEAAFTNRSNAGRTGRGDTTFATYLARRLVAGPAEALRFAAFMVSRKLEQPGPFKGPIDPAWLGG